MDVGFDVMGMNHAAERRRGKRPPDRLRHRNEHSLAIACMHGDVDKRSGPGGRSELRTRTALVLVLESIALHHQIAVLETQPNSSPCFRSFDRLLWILLARWWPQWRQSLMIVQAETVSRWRRNGWSAIWGFRSRGRW